MAFNGERRKKTGGQEEKGGGGGNKEGKRKVKHISALARPTCHSTPLAGCQHAPLQTQLQMTKSSHCPTQGVSSMFHIINCTKCQRLTRKGILYWKEPQIAHYCLYPTN